jgi:hypothetical protein
MAGEVMRGHVSVDQLCASPHPGDTTAQANCIANHILAK